MSHDILQVWEHASQPPPKKLKLGLSGPIPKTFKLHQVVDKVMNMSSGNSTVCTSSDSDLESLSSQEQSVYMHFKYLRRL